MIGLSFGRPPKKLIRPCRAVYCSACSWVDAGGSRGDGDVDTAAVGQFEDRVDDVDLTGADRRVRLDHVGGLVEPLAVEVDEEDPPAPRDRASRTCRQPIGPDPTTITSSPSPTRASSWPLSDAGERLGDRRLGEAEVVGDAVEPVDVEHRSWAPPCTRRSRRGTGSPSTSGWGRRSSVRAGTRRTCRTGWRRSPGPGRRPPSRSTSAPISTISPAISWPMTCGGSMLWWPFLKILTSVPQVEQLRIRSLTSPGPGVGSGTSSSRTSPGA